MEKELEEQRKQKLKNRIYEFQERNQKVLLEAQANRKQLGTEGELTNIVDTGIKKIEEDIVLQFQNAGLSFYSDSIVAEAIAEQIVLRVNRGHKLLVKCDEAIKRGQNEDTEMLTLKNLSPFHKMLEKIRRRFIVCKKKIDPENIKKAKLYLDEYREANRELIEYDLRENIINDITHIICPVDNIIYLYQSIPPIMKNDINPTLIKLGLGDLIPKLEQEIAARYVKEAQIEAYRLPEEGMPALDEIEDTDGFEPGDD